VIDFTATRRGDLARRRQRSGAVAVPVAGFDVPTYYHRIRDVCAALGPISPSRSKVGVAIPPPYLEPRWQQLPKACSAVAQVDALLASWSLNRIGDHVLEFAKRGSVYA
jgi:hypothetical protein